MKNLTAMTSVAAPLCTAVSDVAPVYGKFMTEFRKSERKCN